MILTATAEASEESDAEEGSGGEAADGGATSEVTNADAESAGEGGCHGVENRESEGFAGRQENPDGKSFGVREIEEIPEAIRVTENPGGGCQGV